MYRLIYMKADFEPWWKFEGWEEQIQSVEEFETKVACEQALQSMCQKFRALYEHERLKDNQYYAFWSENEIAYCEGCDEDMQIYHGVFMEEKSLINT